MQKKYGRDRKGKGRKVQKKDIRQERGGRGRKGLKRDGKGRKRIERETRSRENRAYIHLQAFLTSPPVRPPNTLKLGRKFSR